MNCLAVAGFAAMNIMLLSVSVWSGNVTDMTQETRDFFHWLSALIALPAAAYAGQPFFRSALAGAARAAASTWTCRSRSACCSRSACRWSRPRRTPQHAYFDSADHAAVLPAVRPLSRPRDAAQDPRGRRQSRRAQGRVRAPVRRGRRTRRRCRPPALQPGDRLLVRPGERVPADGIVHQRHARRSTKASSPARPRAARVAPGATIYAGSVNFSGALTMRVTAAGSGTLLDEVERLLDKAVAGALALSCGSPTAPRGSMRRWCISTAALTAVGWLVAGAVAARCDHHRDRGADHHLPLRAGAGDPGGAGGRLRRAVPRAASSSMPATPSSGWPRSTRSSSTRPAR